MPIVKQSWVKTPEALENYLAKDRDAETLTTASAGLAEEMASSIRTEHAKFAKNVDNLALTIIQSWQEKESDLAAPQKYNEMGQELAKRIAPGHLAWVVTHTEKNHIHNHIVICSVNSETGKLLKNKRSELLKLHDANNAIARENGFAEMKPRVRSPEANLSPQVRSIVSRGKKSWVFDLSQKADFASAGATTFDEFSGVMKMLGVHVRVEEKNISYFYGDHKKAVRGKTLGEKFNKDGLMKAFKENDERFAKDPTLRARISADIGAVFDGKGNLVGTPSNLLLESASHPGLKPKDYSRFTKIDRRRTRDDLPAIFEERGGVLYNEMKKAREVSIFEYCKENKILLKENANGQTVLRGKEFVVVGQKEWKNTNNGRMGTIIDFVKIHDETTELRAVAKINKNPRLLLLEPYLGEYKSGIQSFYFPKPKAALPETARKTLSAFLNSRGMNGEAAESLLKSGRVHVGNDRCVWLMGEKNESAMEFREDPKGKWQPKRHGKATGAFFESVVKSKKMVVFRDPFEFALLQAKGAVPNHGTTSLFVMMDGSNHQRLDEILSLNPHISEVHIAHSTHATERENGRRMEHEMKIRFNPFDIQVVGISGDLGKTKGRGPDFNI